MKCRICVFAPSFRQQLPTVAICTIARHGRCIKKRQKTAIAEPRLKTAIRKGRGAQHRKPRPEGELQESGPSSRVTKARTALRIRQADRPQGSRPSGRSPLPCAPDRLGKRRAFLDVECLHVRSGCPRAPGRTGDMFSPGAFVCRTPGLAPGRKQATATYRQIEEHIDG